MVFGEFGIVLLQQFAWFKCPHWSKHYGLRIVDVAGGLRFVIWNGAVWSLGWKVLATTHWSTFSFVCLLYVVVTVCICLYIFFLIRVLSVTPSIELRDHLGDLAMNFFHLPRQWRQRRWSQMSTFILKEIQRQSQILRVTIQKPKQSLLFRYEGKQMMAPDTIKLVVCMLRLRKHILNHWCFRQGSQHSRSVSNIFRKAPCDCSSISFVVKAAWWSGL